VVHGEELIKKSSVVVFKNKKKKKMVSTFWTKNKQLANISQIEAKRTLRRKGVKKGKPE